MSDKPLKEVNRKSPSPIEKPQSDPPSDDEVVVLQEVIVACPRPRVPQEVIYIGDFRSPRPQHDGANDSAVGTSRASTNNSGRIANENRSYNVHAARSGSLNVGASKSPQLPPLPRFSPNGYGTSKSPRSGLVACGNGFRAASKTIDFLESSDEEGIDLMATSDSEAFYDSDEDSASTDDDLEALVDYRSASEISVSEEKEFIEVLDAKLDRRNARNKIKKKAIQKKKGKKGRHACNCKYCNRNNTYKRGGGGGGGSGRGGGGRQGSGHAPARRVLAF
ncbi:hypothetical protein AAVH_09779 [Aphelenchoides avenae]|nr:hypothetical protein AAVH_09779 [Aphelenchus avenae]